VETGLIFGWALLQDLGGDAKAMWWEEPQADGTHVVREWSWAQYHEDTMAAARSFIALGVVSVHSQPWLSLFVSFLESVSLTEWMDGVA
jgi:hypothetical protein